MDNETNSENEHGVEFLRDYLYLDIEKVRSIAGQLEFGTPEEFREVDTTKKKRTLGWEKILSGSNEYSEERYLQRSVADSLFPELESALEDGWLIDITEEFSKGTQGFQALKNLRPDGSIFRLTAPGMLFDFEYFSETLANYSTALGGFQDFEKLAQVDVGAKDALKRPSQRPPGKQSKVAESTRYRSVIPNFVAEDLIENFAENSEVSPDFLRAVSRLTRGISRPGVSLTMQSGDNDDSITLSAKFQQNRRYFDADSSMIASRFGLSLQTWTMVGTIGHYTKPKSEINVVNMLRAARGAKSSDDTFSRRYFIDILASLIEEVGAAGLSEIPQHPGISAIPIAVYRSFERNWRE